MEKQIQPLLCLVEEYIFVTPKPTPMGIDLRHDIFYL